MTALSKLQLKQLWRAYFQPTSADFSNLIDSWADYNFTATGTSAVARPVISKLGDIVSVKDFGAVGDGVVDDAPAIRAAIASNRHILVPPGTYLLNSTVVAPPNAFDSPCVLFDDVDNFVVEAYGATFKIGAAAGRCGGIHFNKCNNFAFFGAKFIRDLTGTEKNSAIITSSVTNFSISDIEIVDFYKAADDSGLVGGWCVNGSFKNIFLKNVRLVADQAFLWNVELNNVHGFGCDQNGASGPGQIGMKGFSLINDPPNANYNFTGYTFDRSQNVYYINCSMTNYGAGAVLSSGSGIYYIGCTFYKNGGSGSIPGIGLFIWYANGLFNSVGFPPRDIVVSGCQFTQNGESVPYAALFIDGSLIANADYIENISITGCVFDNNSDTGIALQTPSTNVRNISILGNMFYGANQAVRVGGNLLASSVTIGNADFYVPSDAIFLNSLRMKNNKAIFFDNSSGFGNIAFGVSNADRTYMRSVATAGAASVQNFAGQNVYEARADLNNPAYIYVDGAQRQVLAGAADSGGVGYRVLIVPN